MSAATITRAFLIASATRTTIASPGALRAVARRYVLPLAIFDLGGNYRTIWSE